MPAEKKAAEKKTSAKKTVVKKTTGKKSAAKKNAGKKKPVALEPELVVAREKGAPELAALQANPEEIPALIEDPIGDETDGDAAVSVGDEGGVAEAGPQAESEPGTDAEAEEAPEADAEPDAGAEEENEARPAPKLERLQKIMAQAGVASRRAAEGMITEGRVQVNGKVVTELGTKADAGRDHIRVDGKLLHGAERHRYYVLNKPKGFVTTVKDPEGRPTVMQFFEKMRERLYPVGRLDYLSEGLLLVTNDGELANRLTRAAAGVEKTYLVKVAGVPTEEELDRLRAGLTIDKGKPGEGRVRTSPARVRQVKHGDNPWYEVVLVEGRNRELRKMFEEIGHFVEKIRRVGYGPLVLDQEPGKLRELDAHELSLLRKAADGTLRAGKAGAAVRVKFEDSLPPEKPAFRAGRPKPGTWKKEAGKGAFGGTAPQRRLGGPRPFQAEAGEGRAFEGKAFEKSGEGKRFEAKPFAKAGEGRRFAPKAFDKRKPFGSGAEQRKPFDGAKAGFGRGGDRPGAGARPAWKRDDRGGQGAGSRPADGRTFVERPAFDRPFAGKPAAGRSFGERPRAGTFGEKPRSGGLGAKPEGGGFKGRAAGGETFGGKPAWKKPGDRPTGSFGRKSGSPGRPPFKKAFTPRPPAERDDDEQIRDIGPRKPSTLRIDPIEHTERHEGSRSAGARHERSGGGGQGRPRPFTPRPFTPRTEGGRGGDARASGGGSGSGRARFGREGGGRARADSSRPFKAEGGLTRPFTTSSGVPRAGGARPSSRPGKPAGAGWKPKPGGRPGAKTGFKSGFKSGPRPSGASHGGFKGKPGGRPGGRPGGKRG